METGSPSVISPARERNLPRAPRVSVLIATYNRQQLLRRAIASVLKQDYDDYELVIVDDCSTDTTQDLIHSYSDPRIRYIRNKQNVGGIHGDRAILKEFVDQHMRGEYFVYLCDDDFWIPSDLLSRQIRVLEEHPGVAFVLGGMVQLWPDVLTNVVNINSYWHYERIPNLPNAMFMKGLYPNGLIESERFLNLFAEDPSSRNILTGAAMFRRSSFKKAKVFERLDGSRWQAGYELTAGTATSGDVWYMDDPCIAAGVDLQSASFRGTQLLHLEDCLCSISIAFEAQREFNDPAKKTKLRIIEHKMKHSIVFAYVMNKLSYRIGWISANVLQGIDKIFLPEISLRQFWKIIRREGLPLSPLNTMLLLLSSLRGDLLRKGAERCATAFGDNDWHQVMRRFPNQSTL